MFTREDTSSLPVPDAKFQEVKSHYLRQLIVSPEMVTKKIKVLKGNKSPGVDGIPPKLLMETVEQISIPLARVFNLSLNITDQEFLMAKDLNGYFSSVFTRENINSLPVPDSKFQEAKSVYLGPLIVTPEMVAKKIKIINHREWMEFLQNY